MSWLMSCWLGESDQSLDNLKGLTMGLQAQSPYRKDPMLQLLLQPKDISELIQLRACI